MQYKRNKIALVIAYFGTLPEYAMLFFWGLQYNPLIDVILYTNDETIFSKDNLIVKHVSFETFKKRIQACFDFEIALQSPYKLCDYKPAYGYVLRDDLEGYDYWGHCDLDMILGDIIFFLNRINMYHYDKIYPYGHLCLYKNNEINNSRFMLPGIMDYKDVFSTNVICVFDEIIGMHKKYELLGVPYYYGRDMADISPWHHRFIRVESHLSEEELNGYNYKKQVFYWEKGKVFRAYSDNGVVMRDEFNYIHFQKRDMKILFDFETGIESFYITQYGIIKKEVGLPTIDEINKFSKYNIFREFECRLKFYKYKWIRRIKKYIFKR